VLRGLARCQRPRNFGFETGARVVSDGLDRPFDSGTFAAGMGFAHPDQLGGAVMNHPSS
jgi:hypothetical protein